MIQANVIFQKQQRTGANVEKEERWQRSHKAIKNALVVASKRAALAQQLDISESQISKLLNGELMTYCKILDVLGLEVVRTRYIESLQDVMYEHMPRYSLAPKDDE